MSIDEIKELYLQGNFPSVITRLYSYDRMIPEELYSIAIDSIIKSFGIGDQVWTVRLLESQKWNFSIDSEDGKRVLEAMYQFITTKNAKGNIYVIMNYVVTHDVARGVEFLADLYKSTDNPSSKQYVMSVLGEKNKTEALPIFLDFLFGNTEIKFGFAKEILKKYPIPKKLYKNFLELDVEDCEPVINFILEYLNEIEEYKVNHSNYYQDPNRKITLSEPFSICAAYILAVLYGSKKTSEKLKKKIKQHRNLHIKCVFVDYGYDYFDYNKLSDYIDFLN